MIYTVDRFEGQIAVLLLKTNETIQIEVPRNKLSLDVREGDILKLDSDQENKFHILKKGTNRAYERANKLLQELLNKN